MLVRKSLKHNYYCNFKSRFEQSNNVGILSKIDGYTNTYKNIDDTIKSIKLLNKVSIESELLKEKCLYYNNICKKYHESIESIIELHIQINSNSIIEDTYVLYEEYALYSINIKLILKDNNTIYERGFGSKNTCYDLLNLDQEVLDLLESTLNRKNASHKIQSGFYDVVLDQEATGLLVHECVGHMFEADNNYISSDKVGERIAPSYISIVDDPLYENGFGSYNFDDEGTKASKTIMINNGIIHSLLHSKETAQIAKVISTSNARSIDYSHMPIVRMSNTYMLPSSKYTKDDLISSIEYGLYIKGTRNSTGGNYTNVSFRNIELIKNGEIVCPVRNMRMVGNMHYLLNRIEKVANDLKIFGGGNGGCYKKGQGPLNVSSGGPHIKIHNAMLIPN